MSLIQTLHHLSTLCELIDVHACECTQPGPTTRISQLVPYRIVLTPPVNQGKVMMVRCLLRCGANVNQLDQLGHSAIWAAEMGDDELIVEILRNAGGK